MDKVQGELLKRLRNRLYNLQQQYLSVDIPEPGAVDKCLLLIDHAKREESEVNFRFSTLKTLLHKERVKVNVAKYLIKTLGCKIKSALEAIYDLKYTVLCLLKVTYKESNNLQIRYCYSHYFSNYRGRILILIFCALYPAVSLHS